MDKKSQIAIAAIMGFLAVALGAFGAHGLSDSLSEKMLETYRTGVFYHIVHSVVLLVLALSNYKFVKSFIFLTVGILLFSFSLYLYSLTGMKLLAMITPFGGVSLLIGWILIVTESRKLDDKNPV